MEEDIEEELCFSRDSSSSFALQVAEKSFCEALGKESSPPSQLELTPVSRKTCDKPSTHCNSLSNTQSNISDCSPNLDKYRSCHQQTFSGSSYAQTMPQPLSSLPSTAVHNFILLIAPENRDSLPSIFIDVDFEQHFRRGAEEAKMLLPSDSDLTSMGSRSSLEVSNSLAGLAEGASVKFTNDCSNWSRGRKNPGSDNIDAESRTKQIATSSEGPLSTEFSKMVLFVGKSDKSTFHKALRVKARTITEQTSQVKAPKGGRRHHRKRGIQGDVVDLKHQLMSCSQAVAADNRKIADDLLGKIRLHSSRGENGLQRMASYFADALMAQFTGTGMREPVCFL